MDKLMAQFIEEARELIGRAGQGLLKLEKHPDDAELIDGIFRDVHTLKGSGGVLELAPLVRVLHRGEELLEHARTEPDYLTADCVDALLDALDQVGVWIDDLDSRESLPESAADQAKTLDERLAGFLGERNATPAEEAAPLDGEGTRWGLFEEALPTAATAATTADWLPSISPQQAMNCWRALSPEQPLYAVEFRPDAGCFFRGDDPVLMAASAPGLALLNFELDAPEEALENLDVYQCRLQLGLICQASAEAIEAHFQYEADTVSLTPLAPETLIQPSGQAEDALAEEHLNKLNELWGQGQQNLLLKELDSLLKEADAEGRNASLLSWMRCLVETRPDDALVFDTLVLALQSPQTVLDSQGRIDWATALGQSESTPAQQASTSPQRRDQPASAVMLDPDSAAVGTVLADQQQLMQLCQDDALRPGSFDAAQRVLSNTARALDAQLPTPVAEAGNADVLQNALDDWLSDPVDSAAAATPVEKTPGAPSNSIAVPPTSTVNTAPTATTTPESQPKAKPAEPAAALERDSVAPVIRNFKVDQEEVENLGDLVGELVVAKNALPFLAQRAEQVFGQRQLGREIREQFNVINRITRALQDAMMAVQMLPVSYVFDRFPRLVRDLSRKLGKSIELSVVGDDTEAEKHVIESLADPLVHLMRNSIDHGIESPQQRQAAGKPQTGQIRLEARQQNEWVVIEVADDGAGIDPQMMRKRAYEKGLVDERRLQEMTDEDAIDLIFTPGFSTLDKASELSGRGVGMDVVRTTVEKAGGRLDIDSQIGKGTTFRMQLPLSMSVSQVMQIWIGGQRYGVPIDQVAETVRLPVDRLHRFKGRETILLRERVVPVSRAREQLGLEAAEEGDSIALLVVRQRGELVALMVDEFSEGVEVILKPMEGALENLGVYQGTALLGDGSVLLVLNVGVLLSNAVLEESVDEH